MSARLSSQSIVVATSEQVSCPLGDESAILNLKNSIYYGANPAAASVWKLVQQPKSVAELRDALVDEYNVESQRCEQDLMILLHKMRDEGLIEVRDACAAQSFVR